MQGLGAVACEKDLLGDGVVSASEAVGILCSGWVADGKWTISRGYTPWSQ